MRVLVLGGAGFVGRAVVQALREQAGVQAFSASRRAGSGAAAAQHHVLDARKPDALRAALHGMDAVVNCVTGDAATITEGARRLTEACTGAGRPLLVHLSTMSVYGSTQGWVDEATPLRTDLGWYGQAKIAAEQSVVAYAHSGGRAVLLRPGCVTGADSPLWVGRIAHWLRAGRLGDLGAGGDGWSNLVDVADVACAVVLALRLPWTPGEAPRAFNLAAPDSPRWNRYFMDFAIALQAVPVRRISARRLALDVALLGVPLKVAERLMRRLRLDSNALPPGIPPSLIPFWQQEIRLDSRAASHDLGLQFTPYTSLLATASGAAAHL